MPPGVSNETSQLLNKLSTARRSQRKKSSEISSEVILLEAKCMELQESDRKDYETNLFAEEKMAKKFQVPKKLAKRKLYLEDCK